ncbi:MAG TPA: cyclic nucleotide-binding domain-containing protein [Hansschlegelia sp.]
MNTKTLAPPFAAALAPATWERLCGESEIRAHRAGETILARDRTTEEFYFLLSGRWTMRRFVRGVSEALVWRDDAPGAWVSGVAALEAIAPTDVFADSDCEVLVASRDLVHGLIAVDPALATRLLRDIHRWSERLEVHAALMRAKTP